VDIKNQNMIYKDDLYWITSSLGRFLESLNIYEEIRVHIEPQELERVIEYYGVRYAEVIATIETYGSSLEHNPFWPEFHIQLLNRIDHKLIRNHNQNWFTASGPEGRFKFKINTASLLVSGSDQTLKSRIDAIIEVSKVPLPNKLPERDPQWL